MTAEQRVFVDSPDSEELLSGILGSISDGLYALSCDWRFTFANEPILRRMNLSRSEVLGVNMWELFPGARETEAYNQLRKVMAERRPAEYEVFYPPWDAWFFEKAFPIRSGGLVVYTQNITQRKRTEAALLQSERQAQLQLAELHAVYSSVPLGMAAFDKHLRFTRMNQALADMNGIPIASHIGKTPREVVPDIAEQIELVVSNVLRSEKTVYFECRGTTPAQPGVERIWDEHWFPVRGPGGKLEGVAAIVQDVTEHRRAHEALHRLTEDHRKQREFLERLVESSPLAIAVVQGEELRFTALNAAYRKISGGARRPEVGVTYPEAFPEASLLGAAGKIRAVIRTGESWKIDEFKTPIGTRAETWWEGEVLPLDNEQGIRDSALIVTWDVTVRKQSEAALARNQQTFKDLVEHAPFGVYVVDSDFRISHMNPGSQTGAFLNVRPVIGRDFAEAMHILWPEDVAEQIVGVFRRTLESGEPYSSRDFMSKRGDIGAVESYEWELHRITLPDGRHGVVCYYYNSTKLRLAEQAVRHRGEQFEALVDNAPIGIYLLDSRLHIAHVNPVAIPAFAAVPGGLVGRSFTEVASLMWERRFAEEFSEILRLTLETGWPYSVSEGAQHRIDRDLTEYYEWRVERITLSDGQPGLVCYFRDISAHVLVRKDLEQSREEIRLHRAHLQQVVQQRTGELEQSHQKLRLAERMASLGTLAAGLGHDMGNILVPVRVRLETLEQLGLGESALKELEGIKASAGYLQKLASGLRLLATDPAKGAGLVEQCEVISFWSEAEPVLRNTLPRGLVLQAELPPTECWVRIGKSALMQAIFNLVQNAADAMRPEEGGSVRFWAQLHGDCVALGVRDTGPGMTDDVRRRCMEPFFTTKTRGMSTGLGLALVYGIVQGAGGTIDIESAPGQGTTFIMRFPAGKAPSLLMQDRRSWRAVVRLKDARMRAYVTSELENLRFDIGADSQGHQVDLEVVDDIASANGKAVLRIEPGTKFQEVKGAIHRTVQGMEAGAAPRP